jgi:hypothetical protein
MHNLLITSGNANKADFLKYYLRIFSGHVLDVVEKILKDKKIPLKGLSLAQLHAYIIQVWEEYCLEKRVSKDCKRHASMYSHGFCKFVVGMPDWGCGAC